MGLFDSIKKIAAPILGSSTTGSLIGGGLSLLGTQSTNAASAKAAQEANAFTKEQLQNRHQWEVADLRKAGLNPILSAHSTPSIGNSAKAEVLDPTASALAGAREGREASITRKLLDAQLDQIKSQTTQSISSAKAAETQASLNNQIAQGVSYENVPKKLDADLYTSLGIGSSGTSSAFGIGKGLWNGAKGVASLGKKLSPMSPNAVWKPSLYQKTKLLGKKLFKGK